MAGKATGLALHRIVEQVFHLFDGTVPEKQLRVHLQTHAGRSGELRADVGLEKVFLRIDVGVEFRLRGLLQDTVFVEDRSIEEIVDHLAAAPHIEIHVLVDRKILEKHRIPVIVGIDVGIEPVARARDLLVRKVLHISFAAGCGCAAPRCSSPCKSRRRRCPARASASKCPTRDER